VRIELTLILSFRGSAGRNERNANFPVNFNGTLDLSKYFYRPTSKLPSGKSQSAMRDQPESKMAAESEKIS